MIYKDVEELIGNTPLLEIPEHIHGIPKLKLYAKLELLNIFGSLKDRIAKEMLLPHLEQIKKEGRTVIESSSGNTAKALAILCAKHHIPFEIITNRIKVPTQKKLIQWYGATITELPGQAECPDPTNSDDPIQLIEKEIERKPQHYFHTSQYTNESNPKAHKQTGKEIHKELPVVNYYFGDLGTCGSSVGIGTYLRNVQKEQPKIIGIFTKGNGYVPGGRNEYELAEVGHFKKEFYDEIISASEEEAHEATVILNKQVGIPCATTTGLVFAALQNYFQNNPLKEEQTAVFLACDRIEPYADFIQQYKKREIQQKEQLREVEEVTYEQISPNALLIDIRVPFAYQLKHLPGSINIPEELLKGYIHTNPFQGKEVIFICPEGKRSKQLAARLPHAKSLTLNTVDKNYLRTSENETQ